MLSVLLALTLANPFGSFTGTGSKGRSAQVSASTRIRTSFAWYGDSISAGACVGVTPTQRLDALLPAGWVGSLNAGDGQTPAISGYTADQIANRVRDTSATACLGEPCGVYIVAGGVNTLKHLDLAAMTPEEAADYTLNGSDEVLGLLDAIDYLRTTHPSSLVLGVGVLPYESCSICGDGLVDAKARAAAYNLSFMAACSSRGLLCADPYLSLADPDSNGALLAAYDCGDGIHLSQAGSNLFVDSVHDLRSW